MFTHVQSHMYTKINMYMYIRIQNVNTYIYVYMYIYTIYTYVHTSDMDRQIDGLMNRYFVYMKTNFQKQTKVYTTKLLLYTHWSTFGKSTFKRLKE